MRIRLRTKRDMWLFVAIVAVVSVAASELALALLYLTLGDAAFGKTNAFYMAGVVPALVAVPICFATARTALELSRAHARLKELAHTDALTGLTNRRSFFESAELILDSARSREEPVALLVIDADYFKRLNDTYGHATGDAALQFITEQLKACLRKTDLVCRLGGEEFAILLPGMREATASRLGERILKQVALRPMVWDKKIIEMSVSCGIADSSVGYDMTVLFKAADDALYAAKNNGRNRQVLYSELSLEPERRIVRPARLGAPLFWLV